LRNPSAEIARRVAASPRWRRLGVEARAVILTTSYGALERELRPLLDEDGFDALLMIGVAGRSKRIRIERRALNRVSVLFPDAEQARQERSSLGAGPGFRRSRISAETIAPHLRRRALPCAPSQDAGRYLCNAGYFVALACPQPVLFLHIPKAPLGTKRRDPGVTARRLSWSDRLSHAFVDVALDMMREARRRKAGV
jgi:pyroglutamyl-peptidase